MSVSKYQTMKMFNYDSIDEPDESTYEIETENLKDFSDFTLIPRPEEDKKDLDVSKLRVKTAEEFLYGDEPKKLYISTAPEKEYSLIESGIKKLTNILGFESPLAVDRGISNAAVGQALIQVMASEEGVPVSEFRNSPEFVEKFAQGFTDLASFGILPALKEATTGETEFAPDSFSGYAGKGLGSFAGLLFGPARVGHKIANPITSRIAVTRDMPLAIRTLKQGLKESLILSPTIGAAVFGEALQEKTFKEAASTIISGLESGAITGAIFGVSRGIFPKEVRHRAARIVAGLVGLNAQRALENPDINVWDRPTHEVIFDTAMDVFFMWKGLPRRKFTEFERLTEKMLRDEELTPGEFESIIAEIHELKKEASRENNKEVENILKTEKESPPKPKAETRPADVDPEYTFTSQKGNYYEKIGDKWFDQKGREVVNKFVIEAAERKKVEFGVDENAASDALVAELEAKYKKNIDDITDKEIEDYIEKGIEAKKPVDQEPKKLEHEGESIASELDIIYNGAQEGVGGKIAMHLWTDKETKSTFSTKALRKEDVAEALESKRKEFESEVEVRESEVDWFGEGEEVRVERKRGIEPEPVPEPQSFRQADKNFTKQQLRDLRPYEKIDNIDTLMNRMETEVNAWLDGENVDIASTKKLIEQLAEGSRKWADGEESAPGVFSEMTLAEMENFAEYMEQLGSWVRRAKRGEGGTKLYSGIPVDETAKLIKSGWDRLKGKTKEVIAYHATPVMFDKFDVSKSKLTGVLEGSKEVFFTSDPKGEGGPGVRNRVVKTRLKLKNTKEFDVSKANDENYQQEFHSDRLKKEGYDSVHYKLEDGTDVWSVLYNEQMEIIDPGTKLYDIGGAAAEGVKQIFDKLTNRTKTKVNPKPPDPFEGVKEEGREAVRVRVGKLNLANYDTNKFINKVEQRTTQDQRDVMMFVIEKTDIPNELGRPDLQKVLKRDRKYLEPIAEEIKDHFETGFLRVKKHLKDLSAKQIRDYVTHIWDIPRHKRAEAVRWFSTQDRFMKRRFIETYAEGIKKGFKPKTLDISEIIRIHDAVGNRAIENVRYIDALMGMEKGGIKLLTRNVDEAPMDWIEVNYPALTRRIPLKKTQIKRKGEFVKESVVYAHPDLARPLKVIFEQRFDGPVISAYEAINGLMKQSWLAASLFHHLVLGQSALALIGPKSFKILDPVRIYKALVRGEYELFTNEPVARDAIENGLVQFGASADIPVNKIQGYLDDLARISKDKVVVDKLTKGLAGGYSVWNKALWNYIHDTFKLWGYEALVSKIDPKLNAEDTLKAKREIGQVVNDSFGGQNFEALMLSPREIQAMTWSLLSADWTYSTTRQALGAGGIGKVYKETAGLRAKQLSGYWLRAGLYFYLGMNLFNALMRERDIRKNPQYYKDQELDFWDKTMLGNTVGKKTRLFWGRYEDGSERYFKFDKQFSDFFELFTKFPEKIGGKGAPIPQGLAQFFTGHTLSGFRNDDVYGSKGLDKAIGLSKIAVKSFTPISVQRFFRDNIKVHPLDLAMQSSKGLSRYAAMEYFKKAIVNGDEDMIRDVYKGALRNNLPAYTLFTNALSWSEGELMSEIAKDVKDLEDAKAKLSASTSAYDKRRYGKIVARLSREKADKESGLTRLRSVLEMAKSYRDLAIDKSELHREYGR